MHPHYPGTELVQRLGHQKDFKSSKWYLLGWHSLPTKCYRSRFCCYRINYWVNLPNTLLILILEIHLQFLIYFYCFTLEIIILLLLNYFIVVQLQLSAFSLHPSPPTPAKPTSLPCFHPPPWFCPCVLYSGSWKPFPPLSPPTSPLVTVRLFLISMSLVIFACFSLLLIMFELKLRSYGICLSLPSLLHLA